MNRRIVLGLALVVLFSLNAFPQAAAESALTHATTGTAAAKSGSSLGNSLNQVNNKLSNALSNAVQSAPATQSATQPGATPATTADAAPSSQKPAVPRDTATQTFSVQEAGTSCPAPKNWRNTQDAPAADTRVTVCAAHASAKPFPKTKYKPVVEITF